MTINKKTLESLSNDLFLDLFKLFDAFNFFRAFYDLNTRFNSLLLIHFQAYCVDFRSILKKDFNTFYQMYFPLIINCIIYLQLSDDEDTPYQCAHFQSTYLTIEKVSCLRKFSSSLDTYEEDDLPLVHTFKSLAQNLSITKLVLSSICSQRLMINLFQLLPNLDLNLGCSINDQTNKGKVDQYIATYRKPFWIEHHQWFIQCHWRQWIDDLSIRIYSLLYVFDDFPLFRNNLNYHTKPTCPADIYFSYDSVDKIRYEPSLFNEESLSNIKLNNIEILSLKLSTDHRFFSVIPMFENLFSLNVVIPTEIYQLQLQALLDHVSHLFSLGFESWNISAIPPYQYTSSSIRRLDLEGRDRSDRRHRFNCKE
ncbi:unnamed protein product [Rotaria sordida]|uniref:Uncharacterized protein n=1 Tax=Rotaria sordida TaxID=392033 RepID=A0A818URI1_9BILA|nr:unnamed protein product [Rotaria sordida]CAF3508574.1 unnamed protein product [Rotaria sordida]CAF3704429.1 unnamed protein product [Rotaria sordida]